MIPISYQLAASVKYIHAEQVPFTLVTQTNRQVNDAYNSQLQSVGTFLLDTIASIVHTHVGLPSCMWMRHVKEAWSLETASRIHDSAEAKALSSAVSDIAATFANHKPTTGAKHYALDKDIAVAVRSLLFDGIFLLLTCFFVCIGIQGFERRVSSLGARCTQSHG